VFLIRIGITSTSKDASSLMMTMKASSVTHTHSN
jgi:hypothetical protein